MKFCIYYIKALDLKYFLPNFQPSIRHIEWVIAFFSETNDWKNLKNICSFFSSIQTSVNFSRIFEREVRVRKKCKNFRTQMLPN